MRGSSSFLTSVEPEPSWHFHWFHSSLINSLFNSPTVMDWRWRWLSIAMIPNSCVTTKWWRTVVRNDEWVKLMANISLDSSKRTNHTTHTSLARYNTCVWIIICEPTWERWSVHPVYVVANETYGDCSHVTDIGTRGMRLIPVQYPRHNRLANEPSTHIFYQHRPKRIQPLDIQSMK